MILEVKHRNSLKTRVTLVTIAIFMLSIWALAFHISRLLREDMQKVFAKQQLSTVTFVADEANRELGERLQALGRAAVLMGRNTDGGTDSIRSFLEERPVLMDYFAGGVIALDEHGKVLAELPNLGRVGLDFSALKPAFAALKDGRLAIGEPFHDEFLKAPVFNMVAPVRNQDGDVIGALVGVTDLTKRNFLDQITSRYYGRTGYFLVADPSSRRVVTESNRQGVFQALPRQGANPAIDRIVDGYEESAITSLAHGAGDIKELLVSARRLPVAEWVMVAALPTEEAFSLIREMQKNMLLATVILTLLTAALTWWMLRRELLPIMIAVDKLAVLSESEDPPEPLAVESRDEIGRLISGFNTLLATLSRRETTLQNTLRFQEALMDAMPSPIFYKDANGYYIGCNKAFEHFIGHKHNDIIGKTAFDLAPLDLAERYVQADRHLLANPGVQSFESALLYADGTRRDAIFNEATFMNAEGKVAGLVCVVLDITERKQMESQVLQQALHDTLTQLPNRRLLGDRLKQTLAVNKRSGHSCALMFLDLDNFKPLNDHHGHDVGDLMLIEVAARLKATVREVDTVARFGGDEFVLLLSDLGPDQSAAIRAAKGIAEKIRHVLANPYQFVVRHPGAADVVIDHQASASIGLVVSADPAVRQDDLMRWADGAMYQAKEGGRNAVALYEPAA